MEEELTEQQVYDYTKKYEITDDEVLDCVAVYQLLANGDKWERAIAANLEADAPYR